MLNKKYTVSTFIFNSLKGAREQINMWEEDGDLRSGTKVFEIGSVYVPKLTLVKEKKHVKN